LCAQGVKRDLDGLAGDVNQMIMDVRDDCTKQLISLVRKVNQSEMMHEDMSGWNRAVNMLILLL